MNILLVYPELPESIYSYNEALRYISKKSVNPPLGILTVAAMLPESWNKKFIDCNVTKLVDQDIEWADMICISAMGIQQTIVLELIRKIKQYGKPIIAGGPLFSAYYDQYGLDDPVTRDIDYLVLNEAEITLPLFLKDLENGNPKAVYTSNERPDLALTPIPLWQLADLEKYSQMMVQYSRGCPFNCEFCDILIHFGRVPRLKTPGQMIKEFQAIFDTGWRGTIFIVDDNFIGNKKEVKKMLPYLAEWQKEHEYPFTLYTQLSINIVDDNELMDLMIAANFNNVFIGFESTHLESLKECGKLQNTGRNLMESVRKIQKKGLSISGGFIIGFDSDTESVFDAQIEFIQESGIVGALINILNVPPKTALWERLNAEGRILGVSSGDTTDGTIQFESKMGNCKLLAGYRKIISTLFAPDAYYKRIERLMEHITIFERSKFQASAIIAFLKTIVKIGFFSGHRFLYWRLIIKMLIKKQKAFAYAVRLAVMGEHYFKFTKKLLAELSNT